MMGVSIMAVSRGGQVYYDPKPDFQIFPGDRLLIIGPSSGLKDTERILNQIEARKETTGLDRFEIAEILVAGDSKIAGQTLADLRFRQQYGVTLVGILRGEEKITTITPADRILAGDSLIVMGAARIIKTLKDQEPL